MLEGLVPNLFSMDIPAEHAQSIERYTRELTDKIEQLVLAALVDRQPARLAWGVGQVGFAANRRRAPLKPVDPDLPVLRIADAEGKLRAIFACYACHCTTIGINRIHGDWAGCAQQALEREFPGAVALVALGCGADQNPHPRGMVELAVQHGEVFAAEVGRLVQIELAPLNGILDCRAKWIDLAFDTLPTHDQWQALVESKSAPIAYHAQKNLARLDRGEELPTHLPYLVQTWSFGDDLTMGVLHRKFGLPIYVTARTYQAASWHRLGEIEDLRGFHAGETLRLRNVRVETIRTPHDGADGLVFVVDDGRRRLGILTDLGHVFNDLEAVIGSLDAVLLESNYDPQMLADGTYPDWLKERVAGSGGHLSNEEAAELVLANASTRMQWVCLAHL